MKLSSNWRYIYFLGIGGIGMSALARWFNVNRFSVSGYDRTSTALTDKLTSEGINITFEDTFETIPAEIIQNKEQTLVIYTPAIPASHPQLNYFKDENYTLHKRSQILGMLAGEMQTIGVAGTHGKTTTSTLVTHLLKSASVNTAAFLGGISNNLGTNFLLNEPVEDLKDVWCVVEADEFDRSFLTLFPKMAVVTSTDADHLDIYNNHDSLLESFNAYIGQIQKGGILFLKDGLQVIPNQDTTVYTYGIERGVYHAENLRIKEGVFVFDLYYPEGKIEDINLQVPGFHNVENAVAAAGIALQVGVEPEEVKNYLGTFKGVHRRFQYILKQEAVTMIDDYAHHPTEINALLTSVKALYPEKHITVVFQPHLFTRTRDFADGFAKSLENCDRLYLLDIYPARELPLPGVTSDMLLERINLSDKQVVSKENLLNDLKTKGAEILVTVGAGDIDKLVEPIREVLEKSVFFNQ